MIKTTEIKNKYLSILAPHEKWHLRWIIKKPNILSIGSKAGYICMDSQRFPLSKAINALCIPHPGQETPKYF